MQFGVPSLIHTAALARWSKTPSHKLETVSTVTTYLADLASEYGSIGSMQSVPPRGRDCVKTQPLSFSPSFSLGVATMSKRRTVSNGFE